MTSQPLQSSQSLVVGNRASSERLKRVWGAAKRLRKQMQVAVNGVRPGKVTEMTLQSQIPVNTQHNTRLRGRNVVLQAVPAAAHADDVDRRLALRHGRDVPLAPLALATCRDTSRQAWEQDADGFGAVPAANMHLSYRWRCPSRTVAREPPHLS